MIELEIPEVQTKSYKTREKISSCNEHTCSDIQLVSQIARSGFKSYFCDLSLLRVFCGDVVSECRFLKAELLFMCVGVCAHILLINTE